MYMDVPKLNVLSMWWLLVLLLCSRDVAAEHGVREKHYIISLMSPVGPPADDINPAEMLHEHAEMITREIQNSSILYTYDNIARHMKIYMFSIRVDKSEDLAVIGKMFRSEVSSVEEVTSFFATELVTDVRNLAHGLPYRQVLKRPIRELNLLSTAERAHLQDTACTFEAEIMENLNGDERRGESSEAGVNSSHAASSAGAPDEQKVPVEPVTVFVLDTGIQANHAWFVPDQVRDGFDFERPGKEGKSETGGWDPSGHGTQIAGIIGGMSPDGGHRNSGSSVSSKLVPVRVLGDEGEGKTDDIVAGLDFVIGAYFAMKATSPRTSSAPHSHLPALTHLSLSGPASEALKTLLNALSKVMPVVGAAGDDDSFSCWTSPANSQSAIIAGASMSVSNLPLPGSNFGQCISLNAPGQDILAPFIGDSNREERVITGSSASAAIVTSIIVNVLTTISEDPPLNASYNSQIAESDVSVFLKAVLTESMSSEVKALRDSSHPGVHMDGHTPCALDSHSTLRSKLVERLASTVSKEFLGDVQYDESAPRKDTPTKRLRDRFKALKNRGLQSDSS